MADTTTCLLVVCPACGEEAGLPLIKVEVEIGDEIVVSHSGQSIPLTLRATAYGEGHHTCGQRRN